MPKDSLREQYDSYPHPCMLIAKHSIPSKVMIFLINNSDKWLFPHKFDALYMQTTFGSHQVFCFLVFLFVLRFF